METFNCNKTNLSKPIGDSVLVAIRKIIRSIDLNSKSLMKRVGLTGPQLVVLQEISTSGTISIGEIAKTISLSQGTVTGIMERLEKRGLVKRYRSEVDRRRVLVEITKAGKSLVENSPPLMQETFVEQFNNLQDWEQTMILSTLQRLVSIMDAKEIKAAPLLLTDSLQDLSVGSMIE